MNYHPIRVALTFEISSDPPAMCLLGRPQDFRVKKARWQYAKANIEYSPLPDHLINYQVFIYGRRWLGPGKDWSELDHDTHPTPFDLNKLMWEAFRTFGNGFPYNPNTQTHPMAWDDPLKEDDMLDPTDNPDDFKWFDEEEDGE